MVSTNLDDPQFVKLLKVERLICNEINVGQLLLTESIKNLPDPTTDDEPATKKYVEQLNQGPKGPNNAI
jgi:hypothetical protein